MKKPGNRERILTASLDLFNSSGTVSITTNHIAAHIMISPGNLYFHFKNKAEIVHTLFKAMAQETYALWSALEAENPPPREVVERVFALFFKYRFFHREMFHLSRADQELRLAWKRHLLKVRRLLLGNYARWVAAGHMVRVRDRAEIQFISDTILITSSAFLNFFESPERPARSAATAAGVDYILRFLKKYQG